MHAGSYLVHAMTTSPLQIPFPAPGKDWRRIGQGEKKQAKYSYGRIWSVATARHK